MSTINKDFVKENTTSFGTGSIVFAGVRSPGRTFGSVLGDNEAFCYALSNPTLNEFETGIGIYHSGPNSFSRNNVFESSNANALVNFSPGTKHVDLVLPSRLIDSIFTAISQSQGFPIGNILTGSNTYSGLNTYSNRVEFDSSIGVDGTAVFNGLVNISGTVVSPSITAQVSTAKSEVVGGILTGSNVFSGEDQFSNRVYLTRTSNNQGNALNVSGSSTIAGTQWIGVDLFVSGNTTLGDAAGDITTVRRFEAVNNIGVQGSAVFAGLVNISGTVVSPSISSQISVAKFEAQNAVLTGSNAISGANTFSGINNFNALQEFNQGGIGVDGTAVFNGLVNISGTVTSPSITSQINAIVSPAKSEAINNVLTGSNTHSGQNIHSGQNQFSDRVFLTRTSNNQGNALNVSGSTTIVGTQWIGVDLFVSGNTTFGDTVGDVTTVRRLEAVNNVGVQGSAVFAGLVNISGTVTSPSISSQISSAKSEAIGAILTGSNTFSGLNAFTGRQEFDNAIGVDGTAVFNGLVNISGTVTSTSITSQINVIVSSAKSEVLGNITTGSISHVGNNTFSTGLSGSIQNTSSGLSYLVAGSNVTITSGTNGQITISATSGGGGGGFPIGNILTGSNSYTGLNTFTNRTEFDGSIGVDGNSVFNGDLGISGTLSIGAGGVNIIANDSTFTAPVWITSTTIGGSNTHALNVTGSSRFGGTQWLQGAMFVSGASTFSGTVTLPNNTVTNAMLTDITGFSVIGKPDTGSGDPTVITAGTDGILCRSGSSNLSFGSIATILSMLRCFATLNIQTFTTGGTYTPSAEMKYCLIFATAAGGGGGGAVGASATAPGDACVGGGGGGGGTCIDFFSALQIGVNQTFSIGISGSAGSGTGGTSGGAGGDTIFGALLIASGGAGGTGSGVFTLDTKASAGGLGGTPTTGLVLLPGGDGTPGFATTSSTSGAGAGGTGGSTMWGSGARGAAVSTTVLTQANGAGSSARAPGSGGGGGVALNTASGVAGGSGASGFILIIEFI
jgi:hypothetical protein